MINIMSDELFNITATIWSMANGEITELKHNDLFFVLKQNNSTIPSVYKQPKIPSTRNVKIPYLEKWIQNNNFETFTLDMFFKEYPKQKYNDRLNSVINGLIDKKIITPFNDITNSCLLPLSGKKRFKVKRR